MAFETWPQPGTKNIENLAENGSIENNEITEVELSKDQTEKKDRRMELIKKHHEFAMAAYELEKYLSATDVLRYDQQLNDKLAAIPEKIRQKFEEAVDNYRIRMFFMKKQIDILTEIVERQCNYGMPRAAANQEVANMLWQGLINKGYIDPVGKIEYEIREGYLVLSFERVEDYQRARRKDTNINVSEIEDSGGCYMRSAYIRIFKDYGPVLLIRKDQEDVDVVIKHERQHYINNKIFNDFSLTEDEKVTEGEDESNEKVIKLRHIKDEAIAYIRNANHFRFSFKDTMHSKLYEHLFDGLSEDDKVAVDHVLDALDSFFKNKRNKQQLKSDQWCAIVTYQLASVPLLKFPHWLKALDDYYSKRLEMLRQFNLFVDRDGDKYSENGWKRWIFKGEYSKHYQNYVNENSKYSKELIDKIDAVELEAVDIVFNQEMTFDQMEIEIGKIKVRYDSLLAEFSNICEFLKKDGVLVPSSWTPESYEYGESAYDAIEDESEFLAEVQQQLLVGIEKYPQSELDKIIKSVCTQDEVEGEEASIKKFINYLKKIVHLKNNSRPCVVYIDKEEDYDNNTAYVELDFLVSPKENKRGVKGGRIVINIHSSELVF